MVDVLVANSETRKSTIVAAATAQALLEAVQSSRHFGPGTLEDANEHLVSDGYVLSEGLELTWYPKVAQPGVAPPGGVHGLLEQVHAQMEALAQAHAMEAQREAEREAQREAQWVAQLQRMVAQVLRAQSKPMPGASSSTRGNFLLRKARPLTWLVVDAEAKQLASSWQKRAEETMATFPGAASHTVWRWWLHARSAEVVLLETGNQPCVQDVLQAMLQCQPTGAHMVLVDTRAVCSVTDDQRKPDVCGVCDTALLPTTEVSTAAQPAQPRFHPSALNVGLILDAKNQSSNNSGFNSRANVGQVTGCGENVLWQLDGLRDRVLTGLTDLKQIQLFEAVREDDGLKYYASEARTDVLETLCVLGVVGDALIQHGNDTLELKAWLGTGATSHVFWAQTRGGGPAYVAKLVKEPLHDLTHEWSVLTDLRQVVAEGAALPQAVALCHDGKALLTLPRCQQLTPECVRLLPNLAATKFKCLLPGVVFALEQAHRLGWVHNDIRPANLMLGPAPAVCSRLGAASVQPAPSHAAAAGHTPASTQGLGAVELPLLQGAAAGEVPSSISGPHVGFVWSAYDAATQAQQAEEATGLAIYIVDWGFASSNGSPFLRYGGTLKFASQRLLSLMAAGCQAAKCPVTPEDDLESLVKSFIALRNPQLADSLYRVPNMTWQELLNTWEPWVDAYSDVFFAAKKGAYGSVALHLQQLLPSL